ncbi:MAG: pyridoxine 5'-phosphate synthase [Prevotella sp.]|nr:pyridoxine 5'-phosphate synthase [Bacteroides sp.]MCM1365702.1 pyridoxine 5'-phosphate synthase [Prevotella sp.]MCM1436372.1 pyridoxine 5'-phosphate synthase [Prevotella sp.]
MTRLSVNINKIATLRNARGENVPNVIKFAEDCELFGAQGITVHPRPDERHITRADARQLKDVVTTEYNIEGYPDEEFIRLVCDLRPAQVTLVPDAPSQLTSSSGWDVINNADLLRDIVSRFKGHGIRVSIFVAPDPEQIEKAAEVGADRIELYTKPYADAYSDDPYAAVLPFITASIAAHDAGLGVNAGHDLSLKNLHFFAESLPYLDEVSIGHALISDALYLGIHDTIRAYLKCLEQ